jgi:hypothetical protein
MTEARAQEREARLERRISELERASGADQAELERRLETAERRSDAAETHGQAAGARAQKIEEEAIRGRTQLRKDFIELGDDLRARTRDASAAAVVELRSQIVSAEERLRNVPSPLPVAKDWVPGTVTYRGGVATHKGASWQAAKDTAQTPGGSDWVCLARAGHDGVDGRSVRMRGLYGQARCYEKLDIVLFAGEPFMAKHDAPGLCPGEGWMKLSPRGRRGERGPAGPRGKTGERGPEGSVRIDRWKVDREFYRVTPMLSNGQVGQPLELRSLFETYHTESNTIE